MDEHGLITDKLDHQYMIRIPEIMKANLDKLPPALKKKLNQEILILMARSIHDSRFDPKLYLCSE